MLNLMKTLTGVQGISGSEKPVSDKLMMLMIPLCDKVYNDTLGSLVAVKRGTAPDGERKKIMLVAHMDEIGFMVTGIDDKGFIRVQPIGGINFISAAYSIVAFAGGVKGILIPELGITPNDINWSKVYIDIGAKDKKEAERKVKVGDTCALEGEMIRLVGRRIAGRPLDDRIGCAVLVKIAEKLKETTCPDDVYFVFSTQEEVGMRGAKTAAYGIMPDLGIAYDVTGTGDSIGAGQMECVLGGGAAIKLKDSSLICDRDFADELATCAKANGIKYQFEILAAGGTDTSAMQLTGAGIRVAALSIPTRFIHSRTETCDLSDAEACADLTVAWLSAR